MGLHKLSAGDGYLYLTRQVMALDATHRGRPSLADYYSSKGESPGRWMGSGLASLGRPKCASWVYLPPKARTSELWSVQPGSTVTEAQMKALFGEGLHPNADEITRYLTELGGRAKVSVQAARLGKPYRVYDKENEWIRRLRAGYQAYNLTLGQDRYADLDPEIKAEIRTAVGREMFVEEYQRQPADARELTGFIARQSRTPEAVAGFDLTFTPVKSVSALWAIAPLSVAKIVEDCHHQAVAETIEFLEQHAAFSRMGADGVAQVDTTGLIVAAFDHRDSRAGDPNLHTHCAVSNKVCAIGPDGVPRWLALDGGMLYRNKVAASEFYNTRNEALLIERLGVRFAETSIANGGPGGGDKRPVREIVAPPQLQDKWMQLLTRWSSRSAAIEHCAGELATQFQTQHGREPTAVEMLALNQQANLETRQAKHEPRSYGEQRHTWGGDAVEVFGSRRKVMNLVADVTNQPHRGAHVTDEWVRRQAAQVIGTVSKTRAQWQRNHVRAEAQRALRYADHPGGQQLVDRIVATSLGEHSIAITTHADTEMDEPAVLRRRDGTSVFTVQDSTVYTSAEMMAAERRILAAADLRDGRVVDETSIGLALLEYHAQRGVQLNDGQAAMVRAMATSGARLQLGLAPAATGKTTAMGPLAAAWRNSGGNVIGLAPTAGAAEELADGADIETCDTIAKFVQLATGEPSSAPPNDPAWKWFNAIDSRTLIIVDEAGMVPTRDLDTVRAVALTRGASARLIADDRQLPSIEAGGIIRDLADHPDTVTLTEVVRFIDPAQGAASLAIRGGDPAGLAYYIDRGWIHVGHNETAVDMVFRAWVGDRAAGRQSLMLAPTNPLTNELNQRARLHRLANKSQQQSAAVTLGDGLTASAGDWITTRKNARWLRTGPRANRYVKNGHRWIVQAVNRDGSVTVSPLRDKAAGWTVRLPADYVAAHTTLGYARTVNAAQGATVGGHRVEGNCHFLITDEVTSQQFYVGTSRGTGENRVYTSTSESDPHRIIFPKATHPPTAVEILEGILRRDGSQVSAHTAIAADADPVPRLHRAAEAYRYAVGAGAAQYAGAAVMAAIDAAANAIRADLTEYTAWPVLRCNLAMLAIDGHDPVEALNTAAALGPMGNARDPAAVLDWRLEMPAGSAIERVGPLQWSPAIPDALKDHSVWGSYLTKRAQLVSDLADEVRVIARSWDRVSAPAWARPLLGNGLKLLAEVAVFRAAHGVDPADTRVTGPQQYPGRSAAVQTLIHSKLGAELTRDNPAAKRWRNLAEQFDPRVPADLHWPQLAVNIDDAAKAGADVADLLRIAMQRGPLPDEKPAAALWWRLAPILTSASLDGVNTRLRPAWTPELHALFGDATAETITADPAWPGLVAAVAASGWEPHALLSAGAEHLLDIAGDEDLKPHHFAKLLMYRIELLTHHAVDVDRDVPHPAEHAEPPDEHLVSEADIAEPDNRGAGGYDLAEIIEPQDVDIPALRARRDDAHRHLNELVDAIRRGPGGPAEQAAVAELAELRRRQDEQRAHHEALAQAHTDWVRAEDMAAWHRQLIGNLDTQITAARERGDSLAVEQLQQHRGEAIEQTDRTTGSVATAWTHLSEARAALIEAAGGTENIVTERDIVARRDRALDVDRYALAAARDEVCDLDNRLARAELAAARALAASVDTSEQFIAAHIDTLRAEVALLVAAQREVTDSAIRIPPTSLVGLSETTKHGIRAIAALPFAVIPVRAYLSTDTVKAVKALRDAAEKAGGRVLVTSPASDRDMTDAESVEHDHDWRRVRVYTYTSADGRPVQQVIRRECSCDGTIHKQFRQRYREGREWVWKKPPTFTPALYRAPELQHADPGEWVWLTEGEKDADTAAGLGKLATTNAQGARSFPAELAAQLAGRRVAVVLDRDLAGYERALNLHEALSGVASEVKYFLPALDQPKADLTDHVEAGLWNPDQPFGGLVETSRDVLTMRAHQLREFSRGRDDTQEAVSLDRICDRMSTDALELPAGSLLIVQDAAMADPRSLADIADRAATSQTRVILLDIDTSPHGPGGHLMELLHKDVPWAEVLRGAAIPRIDRAQPDLADLLAQATRLSPSPQAQQLLQQRGHAVDNAWCAYQLEAQSSRLSAERDSVELERDVLDRGLDDDYGLEL